MKKGSKFLLGIVLFIGLQKESGSQTAERRIIRKSGTLFCIVNIEQQG